MCCSRVLSCWWAKTRIYTQYQSIYWTDAGSFKCIIDSIIKKICPKNCHYFKSFFYFHWNTRMKNNAKISPSLNIQKQDCASLVVWFFSQFIFIYYFFMVIFCKKRTELDFLLMDLDTTKHKTYNGKNPKRETNKKYTTLKKFFKFKIPATPSKNKF